MNASTAAAALAALTDDAPTWLPPVDHWEIARIDGQWIVSGQLNTNHDTLGEAAAYRLLNPIVEQSGQQLTDDGKLIRAPFVHSNVQCDIWFLRSGRPWVTPAQCASCPTELAGTGTSFVRLGAGDREAPVICVLCRDRMQAEWMAEASAAAKKLTAMDDATGTVRDLRPGADVARRQIADRDTGGAL